MIEELHARFLPQFSSGARTRIERALAAGHRRDHAALGTAMRDLHSLAGEAGLLGLPAILQLARVCEEAASQLRASHHSGDPAVLVAALGELAQAIDLLPR